MLAEPVSEHTTAPDLARHRRALDELLDDMKSIPMYPPPLWVRAVLAFLCLHSDRQRELYNQFWRWPRWSGDGQPGPDTYKVGS